MTLGEKIKEARKQCGLSQEQLAEKMTVSRSAIAKWETDKGIPDVENLKALARLLNVSVDYLLDDGGAVDVQVIRQVYNLSDYGKGGKKQKKDRLILERFPDAQIHTLLGELKLTKGEKVVDNALGFLTDAPFGIPGLINGIKNLDKEFYLVEKDGKQLFVTVTDEFIETRQLSKPVTGDKFEIGNWKFIKCAYNVQASSGLYEKVKKVGMLLLFPIWWYVAPTIINTFLESYDLAGKTIIPFATSGGSGMGKTNEKLAPSCPGATLKEGNVFGMNATRQELADWANQF